MPKLADSDLSLDPQIWPGPAYCADLTGLDWLGVGLETTPRKPIQVGAPKARKTGAVSQSAAAKAAAATCADRLIGPLAATTGLIDLFFFF